MSQCPCGSHELYVQCCGQYIDGAETAPTPEALMRSRYTAYTQANMDYIQKTMQGEPVKDFDPVLSKEWAQHCDWQQLQVLHCQQLSSNHGFVEFIAHYQSKGQHQHLHEVSEFRRISGVWFYVGGEIPAIKRNPIRKQAKLGRNDPCHCGSSKKYKQCCMLKEG